MLEGGRSHHQVMMIFSGITFISLFPLMVTDLVMAYQYSDNFCAIQFIFQGLNLLVWIRTDGFIKIAILSMTCFFRLAAREIKDHHLLVVCQGLILRFYWLFELGWMITGAVMFWNYVYPEALCDKQFSYFMWATLIIHFILIPVNLVVSSMRGKDGGEQVIISQRVAEFPDNDQP